MTKTMRILTLTALLATATAGMASADSRDRSFGYYGWGPRAGLSVEPDQIVFGAHLDMGEPITQIRFQPNVEFGFGDDTTVFEVNAPLHFRFSEPIDVWSPYVGAELGWAFASYDEGKDTSDLGVKIVGGFERHISGGDKFFIEGKIGLSDEVSDFKFLVGWTFVN
jgi:hypothetical protein